MNKYQIALVAISAVVITSSQVQAAAAIKNKTKKADSPVVLAMKVRSPVKKKGSNSKIVRRKGSIYIINKINPKSKEKQDKK